MIFTNIVEPDLNALLDLIGRVLLSLLGVRILVGSLFSG